MSTTAIILVTFAIASVGTSIFTVAAAMLSSRISNADYLEDQLAFSSENLRPVPVPVSASG